MKRLATVPQIAAAMLFCMGPGLAQGSAKVTVSPDGGHPKLKVFIDGRGFGAKEAVDIYFDTADVLLAVTDKAGRFSGYNLRIPASATPGTHWVTAIGRRDGIADQVSFRVRTDWPQIGFVPQAKSLNPYENVIATDNAKTLDTFWTDSLKASYDAPSIVKGHLYVPNIYGVVVLDADSGQEEWQAYFDSFGMGTPALSTNGYYLYLGDFSGVVHAVNLDTHNEAWRFTAPAGGFTSPTIVNNANIVVVATASDTSDGILYALDASNGAVKWSYNLAPGDVMTQGGAIAAANGLVYGVTYLGNVVALDAATGSVRWTAFVDNSYGSPVVSNGIVYASQIDGKLYAFNAQTGSTLWTANTGGSTCYDPAVGNGIVYLTCADKKLYAFDAGSGTLLWTASTGSGVARRPAVANGVVFAGCDDLKLYAFDARSGSVLWTAAAGGYVGVPPVIVDGTVYFNTADQLTAYALDGGSNAIYRRHSPRPAYASLHPDFKLKPAFDGTAAAVISKGRRPHDD
jgi:outer membrane protein assembly factor BamB